MVKERADIGSTLAYAKWTRMLKRLKKKSKSNEREKVAAEVILQRALKTERLNK